MKKTYLIGLLQAIGVIGYCVLIALLFNFLDKTNQEPGFLGVAAMLVVLVFSAAVSGSIVFGYPVYLFFKEGKIKEALQVLFFTGVFCLLILGIAAFIFLVI